MFYVLKNIIVRRVKRHVYLPTKLRILSIMWKNI